MARKREDIDWSTGPSMFAPELSMSAPPEEPAHEEVVAETPAEEVAPEAPVPTRTSAESRLKGFDKPNYTAYKKERDYAIGEMRHYLQEFAEHLERTSPAKLEEFKAAVATLSETEINNFAYGKAFTVGGFHIPADSHGLVQKRTAAMHKQWNYVDKMKDKTELAALQAEDDAYFVNRIRSTFAPAPVAAPAPEKPAKAQTREQKEKTEEIKERAAEVKQKRLGLLGKTFKFVAENPILIQMLVWTGITLVTGTLPWLSVLISVGLSGPLGRFIRHRFKSLSEGSLLGMVLVTAVTAGISLAAGHYGSELAHAFLGDQLDSITQFVDSYTKPAIENFQHMGSGVHQAAVSAYDQYAPSGLSQFEPQTGSTISADISRVGVLPPPDSTMAEEIGKHGFNSNNTHWSFGNDGNVHVTPPDPDAPTYDGDHHKWVPAHHDAAPAPVTPETQPAPTPTAPEVAPTATEVPNVPIEAGPNDGVTQMIQHSSHGGGVVPEWAQHSYDHFRSWAESQGIFGPDGSPVIPTGATGYFDAQGNYWIDFHNHVGPQLAIDNHGNVTDVLRNRPFR